MRRTAPHRMPAVDPEILVTILLGVTLMMLSAAASAALRERFHPAVVFPAHWGLMLLAIAAAAPLGFYGVHPWTAIVFLLGGLVFVAGGIAGDRIARSTGDRRDQDPWDLLPYWKLALVGGLLHVPMVPLWWQEMVAISGDASDLVTLAFRVRWKTVSGEESVGPLVGNYLVLGLILTPILAMGVFRGRLPAWLFIASAAPWLMTNLITNGRASLVQLILAVAYLRICEPRRLRPGTWLAGLGAFLLVFGGGVILVAKGNASIEDAAGEIALAILTNLSEYALQGPVLFSRYFMGETDVVSTWDALVFPCSVLERLGMCTVGELHQEFSEFGRNDQFGNVYTVYFSVLPKYGPIGFVLIIGAYGAWAAWHHRRHRQHAALFHSLLAAYLFSAVVLSIFSDRFAPSLNFLIKTVIVCALVQQLIPRWASHRRPDTGGERAQRPLPLAPVRT